MHRTKRYTIEDVRENAKKVYSIAALLKSLGLKQIGGNYINIKRKIQMYDIDCSHFTGQGWNNGKQLKDYRNYTRSSRAKPHLIKERGHKCESCDLSKWLGYPIMLEIHHIDGDRTNNDKSNLQLLCPNCHATTDNWRNRKMADAVGLEPTT